MMIFSLVSFSFLLIFDFFSVLFFFAVSFFVMLSYCGGFYDGLCCADYLGLSLMFVSVWIFVLSSSAMASSQGSILCFWAMLIFTLLSFTSDSYMFFYACFEFVFLVMFFYLLGWGKTMERMQASFYMFFYTLFFSLPFLLMLVQYQDFSTGSFFLLSYFSYADFFWVFMMMVFMVKLPIFGFHLWLPKAHVEAPVGGSMLLAGVLLKLGGYGILRFLPSLSFFTFSASYFLSFFFYVSLYGMVFLALVCSRQSDMKMLIAYSSVVHMSLAFLGFFSYSYLGKLGSILMMVAHGFVSSFLFYCMTEGYSFLHSRSLLILKGFLSLSSLFCLFWFLGCFLNLSVPPFMSFFSEIFILGSMTFVSMWEWGLLLLGCFFTGVYCTYMYLFFSHGFSVFTFSSILNSNFFLFSFCHGFYVFLFPVCFLVL